MSSANINEESHGRSLNVLLRTERAVDFVRAVRLPVRSKEQGD